MKRYTREHWLDEKERKLSKDGEMSALTSVGLKEGRTGSSGGRASSMIMKDSRGGLDRRRVQR